MSTIEVAKKGLRLLRKFRAHRMSKAISNVELLECLSGYERVKDFLLDFRSRRKPLFFLKEGDLHFELYREALSGNKEAIINDANETCAHNFDLLGSGKSNVSGLASSLVNGLENEHGNQKTHQPENYRPIDWYSDFKTGTRWSPGVLYTETEIIKGNGSDIKVPWELSRFQHLSTLGKAYWLSGNEKYAREFVEEINDWIESNPPLHGVNWTCSMDIAIRAVNWIWGYYFFNDSPSMTEEFLLKFLTSLLIHGKHIRSNLERESRIIAFGSALLKGKFPCLA